MIRGLRHERGLSLRDLGRATGFSIGFLSLVKRGAHSGGRRLHPLQVDGPHVVRNDGERPSEVL
jgi:transcriptional regulator with XRE-family HTH domain